MNYTVKAANANENVTFKFEFTPPAGNPMLGNLSIKFKNGTSDISIPNGSMKNLAQFLQNATLIIENQNQSSTPYTIELVGADLTKTINTNLTSGINATNFSSNGTYVGFDSGTWQEMAQNLGVDAIRLNISIPNSTVNTSSIYNNLFKCASDNITSCTNVTGNATKLGGGNSSVDWVYWEVPTSIGFSVYGYSGAGNTAAPVAGSNNNNVGGGSSSSTVAPVVAPAVVPTPAPAALPAAAAKPSNTKTSETSETTDTTEATEITTVESDDSATTETITDSKTVEKDLAGKAFANLFSGKSSGLGALIVLVLIVVLVVGIMYYKKKSQ